MEHFLNVVAEIMNVSIEEISLDTEYKNFEQWDSLMMLTLIMEIEEEYDINISMEQVGNIRRLNDLYEMTLKP